MLSPEGGLLMKNAIIGLIVVQALAFGAVTPAIAQSPSTAATTQGFGPASLAPLVEKLLPAVVNISSTQKIMSASPDQPLPEMPQFPPGSPFEDFFQEFMNRHGGELHSTPPASLGSGFVVDADKGLIVTNAHVIQDADTVRVTFHDDSTLPAEVMGRDEKTDLALLRVKTTKKLTAVKFGDSAPLRVGDWVIAIGNPFGLGGTVTTGIISAQQRDINAGPYDDFIQTDASINRGNSGGPMFNMNGEVIGINTAIYSPSGGSVGIGFAIPSNLAKPVIDQLIQYGKTRRGWLGVRIQTVTEEIAESLSLPESNGALIASVTPTGPAEKAGLKAGDVILDFDGKKVTQMRSLPRIVAEAKIDTPAELTYWRDGKKATTTVTVGELEKAEETGLIATGPRETQDPPPAKGTALDRVGLSVRPITDEDRNNFNIDVTVQGVLVSAVIPGSMAANKGLTSGDVIVEINQKPATDPQTARDLVDEAAKAGRSSVLLLVSRDQDVRFIALRIDDAKDNTPKKTDMR